MSSRLGLGALVSTGARMVLRHLERRPARAASTVVDVALAIGLLAGTMALFASPPSASPSPPPCSPSPAG